MSGHDRESGRSEGENDFASLEHLAYLEHTEYRVPMRNSGWGEEEEEREILRQILARGHFAPRTFCPTDKMPQDKMPQGHFAPGHFAPNRTNFWKVDILPQL